MKIHVLTPFWRKYLIPTLIHYLEPHNIEWYPLISPNEQINLEKDNLSELFNREWIHPVIVSNIDLVPGGGYKKFNDFLDTQEIIDNDYYCFMSDDDMYEPGFFDIIRKQTAKIIMCSMYRGNHYPKDKDYERHGSKPLIMKGPEDIRIRNVAQEQFVIKGSVFKENRWDITSSHDDGNYAIKLKEKYGSEILYLPDLFVFFNYFQPRRYNIRQIKRRPLLKSTWELPVII